VDPIGVRGLTGQVARAVQLAAPMARLEASGDGLTARRLAFERLTDQRLLRAYRLATLVLGDAGDAQDAVHDAAVLAWTRFDELRDRSLFDAWFDRIVVNACRQRLRQRRIRPLVTAVSPEVEVPLADGASGRAEREALRRALDRLTPEHRTVVVLRHLEGYSNAEIAARTGEREGTVKSRLHYALRELRAAYEAAERGTEGHR
jgi:RNA polymerase sigma-70 factor (ECF subfamily)